jgi:hypothetical protein
MKWVEEQMGSPLILLKILNNLYHEQSNLY